MNAYVPVAIVTLLALVVYFGMAVQVARTHVKTGVMAPAMTGDPLLERAVRAQTNTLEWMPIFLPSLWLFAIYWSVLWASVFGLIWIVGRIAYFVGYLRSPGGRTPGFLIQTLAAGALMFGALGRLVWLAATGAP